MRHVLLSIAILSLILVNGFLSVSGAETRKIAIEANVVHTMGPQGTLKPGVVLIDDGKITAVGSPSEVKVPKDYVRLHALVVTPGLIDAKTSLGLSGIYNVPGDQDQDESTDPNTADVRALDSFNPREKLLEYVLSYGVTTVQAGPGPDNPIAGQAGIFKTIGAHGATSADQMAIRPVSAMVFNLGEHPKEVYGGKGKAPVTRMATAQIIRKALLDARNYLIKHEEWESSEKKDPSKKPALDLKLDALGKVVNGELSAIFVADREDDIATAIRIGQEFKLKMLLAKATEGYLMRDLIRQASVPVLVGPTMQRLDALQTENATLENAALLADAGIPIAFMSGFEGYVPKTRVLLFEAAVAMANGLGFEGALRAATIDSARILGIDDRVGSLQPGKDGDVVLFDGDPFEYTTHVETVVVNGEISYQHVRK